MKRVITSLLIVISYSVNGDSWNRKADFLWYTENTAGFAIGNKGYIGTGCNYQGFVVTSAFWEFDPIANSWTQKADFGGTPRCGAVGFSIDSLGYIGTGGYLKDFWEYHPSSNNWIRKADFGGSARSFAVGFSIGNKGYIGTGSDSTQENDFWEYDPIIDSWNQKTSIGSIGRYLATGFSILNKGYIGCGYSHLQDFWEYDPSNNTWTQKADFSGGQRKGAAGFSIGSSGYLGTGDNFYDFLEYNPATNVWTPKANAYGVNSGRSNGIGFSINNKGYLGLGGSGGTFDYPDFWEYTPDSATGIEEESLLSISLISLYPNPASDKFFISSNQIYSEININVFNSAGQSVFEKAFASIINREEVELPKLPDGIYFVKIYSGKASQSMKLVIQNKT